MKSEADLRRATVPEGSGADFRAERVPGLALITPLNSEASAWLHAAVSDEASWSGETLVMEFRYVTDLVDGAIDAGFLFER